MNRLKTAFRSIHSIVARCLRLAAALALATATAHGAADLHASMTLAAGDVPVGGQLVYTLAVDNAGPAVATSVVARVTLPPAITFLSSDAGGTFDSSTSVLTFQIGDLGKFEVGYRFVGARAAAGRATVSALVTSAITDPNLDNNHALVTEPAPGPVPAGAYAFYHAVDTETLRPAAAGAAFVLPLEASPPPAIDGGKVVFLAAGPGGSAELWSVNLDGTRLTPLADAATPLPGGDAAGFQTIDSLRLRNGVAAFLGFAPDGLKAGLFSVPVEGGNLRRVANQETSVPGGAALGTGFTLGTLSDGYAAVAAGGGIWAFPVGGAGAPRGVVRPGAILPFPDRSETGGPRLEAPATSGDRAVFVVRGASSSAIESGFNGEETYTALATAGDFSTPLAEGDITVFAATYGPDAGVYRTTRGAAPLALADTRTAAPGGSGFFTSFGPPGTFSLDGGEVVFVGVDEAGGSGLYSVSSAGGTITRIVAPGDSLGGGLVLKSFAGSPIGINSLGGHQVVFRAEYASRVKGARDGVGIFVATKDPRALVPVVTVTAETPEVTQSGGRPGDFVLNRAGGDASKPLTIRLKLGGAARAGVDYRRVAFPKMFKPGKVNKRLFVTPIDRGRSGGDLKVKVTILPDPAYVIGDAAKAKLKIVR